MDQPVFPANFPRRKRSALYQHCGPDAWLESAVICSLERSSSEPAGRQDARVSPEALETEREEREVAAALFALRNPLPPAKRIKVEHGERRSSSPPGQQFSSPRHVAKSLGSGRGLADGPSIKEDPGRSNSRAAERKDLAGKEERQHQPSYALKNGEWRDVHPGFHQSSKASGIGKVKVESAAVPSTSSQHLSQGQQHAHGAAHPSSLSALHAGLPLYYPPQVLAAAAANGWHGNVAGQPQLGNTASETADPLFAAPSLRKPWKRGASHVYIAHFIDMKLKEGRGKRQQQQPQHYAGQQYSGDLGNLPAAAPQKVTATPPKAPGNDHFSGQHSQPLQPPASLPQQLQLPPSYGYGGPSGAGPSTNGNGAPLHTSAAMGRLSSGTLAGTGHPSSLQAQQFIQSHLLMPGSNFPFSYPPGGLTPQQAAALPQMFGGPSPFVGFTLPTLQQTHPNASAAGPTHGGHSVLLNGRQGDSNDGLSGAELPMKRNGSMKDDAKLSQHLAAAAASVDNLSRIRLGLHPGALDRLSGPLHTKAAFQERIVPTIHHDQKADARLSSMR